MFRLGGAFEVTTGDVSGARRLKEKTLLLTKKQFGRVQSYDRWAHNNPVLAFLWAGVNSTKQRSFSRIPKTEILRTMRSNYCGAFRDWRSDIRKYISLDSRRRIPPHTDRKNDIYFKWLCFRPTVCLQMRRQCRDKNRHVLVFNRLRSSLNVRQIFLVRPRLIDLVGGFRLVLGRDRRSVRQRLLDIGGTR